TPNRTPPPTLPRLVEPQQRRPGRRWLGVCAGITRAILPPGSDGARIDLRVDGGTGPLGLGMLSSTYSLGRSIGKGAQALLQLPGGLLPARESSANSPTSEPMGG